ncbi:MAG: DMT family transporter [Rhodospirillaceae bacterium]|jgi:bacterial/archaeal transporter family-2 protein|nr:DMT family transporter [Rhodospirillaceae bacterium]MBT6140266.1 DMT family transporter [Rhodospirillaceae bacterium]
MSAVNLVYLLIAVALGCVIPMQAGINSTIARFEGHPLWGALTNTIVASLALVVVIVVMRIQAPTVLTATKAPWWAWSGGVLGACLVFGSLYFAPKMGAASFVTASVFGTIAASLVIDHFGLLGFVAQPVSMLKLAGAILVVVGMLIVQTQR